MLPDEPKYSGPFPDNESERISAIKNFDFLHKEDDGAFDCFTGLAQRYFATPYALISIVDKELQWFKAKRGIDVTSTSRAVSFCTHTILGPDVMVVNDASKHPDFKDHALVTGPPSIRFYAGAPIILDHQYAIGALCVIDDKPRDIFPAEDVSMLKNLAAIISTLLGQHA